MQVKHAAVKVKRKYPEQLCLEVGFVLMDSTSADKSFQDFIFSNFHARNSYFDNRIQQGLPFSHMIKCG